MLVSTRVVEISGEGVEVEQDGKKQMLSGFDSIVLALGYTPVSGLYEQVKEMVPETYLLGDARNPGNVMEVLSEAIDTGRLI